jgi:hypothetical protein
LNPLAKPSVVPMAIIAAIFLGQRMSPVGRAGVV